MTKPCFGGKRHILTSLGIVVSPGLAQRRKQFPSRSLSRCCGQLRPCRGRKGTAACHSSPWGGRHGVGIAFALFCESGEYFHNWSVTCVAPLCCPRLGFLELLITHRALWDLRCCGQDECLLVTVRPFTLLFIAWFECYTSLGTEAD